MNLSKHSAKFIANDSDFELYHNIQNCPERILQFGFSKEIRASVDLAVHLANKSERFNGRIITVLKDSESSKAMQKQDNLYSLIGSQSSDAENNRSLVSVVGRSFCVKTEWNSILRCAEQPLIKTFIVDIHDFPVSFIKEPITTTPPESTAGKVLALLHERYQSFGPEAAGNGCLIISVGEDGGNQDMMEAYVLELAHLNGLSDSFIEWLEKENTFTSGFIAMPAETKRIAADSLPYKDRFLATFDPKRKVNIEMKPGHSVPAIFNPDIFSLTTEASTKKQLIANKKNTH